MHRTRLFSLLLILTGLAVAACAREKPTSQATSVPTVQAGAIIVLAPAIADTVSPDYLEATRRVVQERLDGAVAGKTQVAVDAQNLTIMLGDGADLALAAWLATQVGIFELWSSPLPVSLGGATPRDLVPVMNGLDIARARAEREHTSSNWQVTVEFTAAGTQKMEHFSTSTVGRYLVISRDGYVQEILLVQSPVSGSEAVLSYGLAEVEAKNLAALLNSGALPVPLTVISVNE